MLFTIISFLAFTWITLKILNYMFIECTVFTLHVVEICPYGLQSTHLLALLFYYARISCKQTNS